MIIGKLKINTPKINLGGLAPMLHMGLSFLGPMGIGANLLLNVAEGKKLGWDSLLDSASSFLPGSQFAKAAWAKDLISADKTFKEVNQYAGLGSDILKGGDFKNVVFNAAGNGLLGKDVTKDIKYVQDVEQLSNGNPSGLLDVPGINATFNRTTAAAEAKFKSLFSKAV